MNATQSQAPHTLTVTHVLAELLERLDLSPEPVGAEQYRSVARQLAREFASVTPGEALNALLESHPAAAELYENPHYEHAGLCRSALDAAVHAETQARAAIARARKPAFPIQSNPQDKEDKHHGKS
jgi:hypothetical protein